jgi:hypothetical protein
VSQPALDELRGLEKGKFSIPIHIWDKNFLEKTLHENEQLFEWTLVRFFPQSYNSTRPLTLRAIENLFELVQGDQEEDDESFIGRVQDICESTDDRTLRFRFGEALLYRLTENQECKLEQLYWLLRYWTASPKTDVDKESEFRDGLVYYLRKLYISDFEESIDNVLESTGNQVCSSAKVTRAQIVKSGDDFKVLGDCKIICVNH